MLKLRLMMGYKMKLLKCSMIRNYIYASDELPSWQTGKIRSIPVYDQKIKKTLSFPLCIVDCLIFYVVLAVFTDGYIYQVYMLIKHMYIKYDNNDNSHRKEKLSKIIRIAYMECIIHYYTSKSWWILCTSRKWLKYCRRNNE